METVASGYMFLTVLGLVLVIAWIVLPFAVIGTKPLLRELISETRKTRLLLEQISAKGAVEIAGPNVFRNVRKQTTAD